MLKILINKTIYHSWSEVDLKHGRKWWNVVARCLRWSGEL